MSCLSISPPSCGNASNPCCPDEFGCPGDRCPDFEIKRHDTRPPFVVNVEDENGDPLDLTGLVLEANMWANAKLKKDINDSQTTIQFLDNIGFQQVLVNDIIVATRTRGPEYMKITGFDENNFIVNVQRGVSGTTPSSWKKGTKLKIFRFMNAPGVTEMVFGDVTDVGGAVSSHQLVTSYLVYEWEPNDTCAPGCFWFEYKLIKMLDTVPDESDTDMCAIGLGVEWVRRFPACGEYLIKVCDTPTQEFPGTSSSSSSSSS